MLFGVPEVKDERLDSLTQTGIVLVSACPYKISAWSASSNCRPTLLIFTRVVHIRLMIVHCFAMTICCSDIPIRSIISYCFVYFHLSFTRTNSTLYPPPTVKETPESVKVSKSSLWNKLWLWKVSVMPMADMFSGSHSPMSCMCRRSSESGCQRFMAFALRWFTARRLVTHNLNTCIFMS